MRPCLECGQIGTHHPHCPNNPGWPEMPVKFCASCSGEVEYNFSKEDYSRCPNCSELMCEECLGSEACPRCKEEVWERRR
jgi:hypothetical protein